MGRVGELEREFIERRNLVQKQVLVNSRKYLALFSTEQLEDQILMHNGLALEASRLDDDYRRLIFTGESNPNYEQLIVMYRGAKSIIRREIKNRQRYSEV